MMAYRGPVALWEIYRADLDPGVGSEQAGASRPVLILSADDVNRALPIVKKTKRRLYPLDVQLPKDAIGNQWTPVAMPYQLRTISKMRLRQRIGRLSHGPSRRRIEDALMVHLGITLHGPGL